jgi:aminopeptidase N
LDGEGLRRGKGVALLALLVSANASAASPDGYDLLETTLAIVPNVAARTIAAVQTTTLRTEAPLRELRFDSNSLSVTSATLDGEPMTWRLGERALVLRLPRNVAAGETVELRFEYRGAPARGLVFGESSVYSSNFTCDWLLCALDRPGDKFDLHIELAAPAGWRAFVSETARPYSAYVHGFAAGAWAEARERAGETELVYASASATEPELRAMFVETPRMIDFYREVAGLAFPHATYTQLLVTGSAAQEGAGFAILGDDVVRPVLADPSDDWAIAHELAHQYWGNLLTCAAWSEFWLNEGLTTFVTAAWKQRRWGEDAYQREIATATTRWSAVGDAGWDKPLAFAGSYPDLRTRRAIQYSKGMLFFVELRRVLGDGPFWRGLRAYTRQHAGGVVVSADLQRALEGETRQDLDALFDEWVYDDALLGERVTPAVR